jgi:hypothetical protein
MATRTDSQSAPLIVHGSRALPLPKPSRRYEEHRSCIHPGCDTKLSSYNAYDTCFNHTFPWSARKTASARRRRKPKALGDAVTGIIPQSEAPGADLPDSIAS